jgi:integrase
MARNTSGDGSLYKTADGRWRAAVSLPGGGRRYLSGRTKSEVAAKRREVLRAIESGQTIGTRRPQTLAQYLDEWLGKTLPNRVAAGRLSQDTLDSYATLTRLHVLPHLGGTRLDRLTPALLRDWITLLLAKPRRLAPGQRAEDADPGAPRLSPRTVTLVHAVLRAALNDALRDEVPGLRRNVAELVEPPARTPSRAQPLDLQTLPAVLGAIEAHRWRALWLTYLGLGLRKGEALGLLWSDVDLETGLVTVQRSLRRRGGRLVDGPVKTQASSATVPIPRPLVAVLAQHRAVQQRKREQAYTWSDPDRVFTTSHGTPLDPRNVNYEWTKVCAAAGIDPIRPHDLRHSMATLALRQGVDIKTIQSMLRHSRLATTADLYTHVLAEVQRCGADRIGDLLSQHGVGSSAATDP